MKKWLAITMLTSAFGLLSHGDAVENSSTPSVVEHHIFLKIVPPEGDAPLKVTILPPAEMISAEESQQPDEIPASALPGDTDGEEAAPVVQEETMLEDCLIVNPAELEDFEWMLEEMMMTGMDGKSKAPMGLMLFIFVLAIFLGFELISKVPSQLHTPLMSGSNAISGITIVGAMVAAGMDSGSGLTTFLGTLAVIFATINVVGGYLVTDRMLGMFKKKDGGKS